ncbi:hypothetical protein SAMN02787144_1003167 [Streptomyces atratus]|uniref:NUDIX hydrolase n=1 Tax=Streptomyces atratus TaxID=1893 RepID=A0A1K1X998_STRAR|nr:hypothetical protein SAMN02787144_1003167 [Streptomyces atratus]
MPLPSPRLTRIAHLLLLDHRRHRVLLRDAADALTPPHIVCGTRQSYHQAATQAAGTWWGLTSWEAVPVIGHAWATPPGADRGRRTERRLLMATVTHPLRPRSEPAQLQVRWWNLGQVRQSHRPTHPTELADIVEGYWDGWLPDGPLTVEWA